MKKQFIRGEGLILRPSGAVIGVLNPRPIPRENEIPRRTVGYANEVGEHSAAGYFIFLALFGIFCTVNVIGQESPKNFVAAGINLPPTLLPCIDLEYERLLNNKFSIGVDIGMTLRVFPYLEIIGKWYPWGKTFFVGIGLGAWLDIRPLYINRFFAAPMISPEIGWKINIGKENKWIIIPYIIGRFVPSFGFYPIPYLGLKIGYKI